MTVPELLFVLVLGYNYPGGESFSLMFVLLQIIMSIANWSWVVFILSLGVRNHFKPLKSNYIQGMNGTI